MKKSLVIALLFVTSISHASAPSSDKGKLGVGIVLGAPTGFSLKYWENQRVAYQGYLGGMVNGGLMLGADYLQHTDAFRRQSLPFYYGAGLFLGDAGIGGPDFAHNRLALGIRGVFGAEYLVPSYPFGIALDLGPSLLLTPVVGMGIELSVAFRFYP